MSRLSHDTKEQALAGMRLLGTKKAGALAAQITVEKLNDMYIKAVNEGAIDPLTTSFGEFTRSYERMALKKDTSTYVQAMQRATTDNQKAALLMEWKKGMTDKEFLDLKQFLVKHKLVGPGVANQMVWRELKARPRNKGKSIQELLRR